MKKLIVTVAILLSGITNVFAQLPDTKFAIDGVIAIVIADPQNDFLSPDGVTWELLERVKQQIIPLKI